MSSEPEESQTDQVFLGNYCVSFVDLLGQREALHQQALLPQPTSADEKEAFLKTLRASVGSISALQKHAKGLLTASKPADKSGLRRLLSFEDQKLWDEMSELKITTQNWSDGILSYSCLGDPQVKCQMNNVFQLFVLTGTLCFVGLASKRPIRGALEIAWAVELSPGELYGAAVAGAYELESSVAGYPRIVIGSQLIQFINMHCANTATDSFSQNDRVLAQICQKMIAEDADGHPILHYLGEEFQQSISKGAHTELYDMAKRFVHVQLLAHQENKNSKLAFRYAHLADYFESHPPIET